LILKYLNYKFGFINFLKKKLPIHNKLYIFILFVKTRDFEYFKILIKLVYNQIFVKKINWKINKKKISFIANNFYTVWYFIYDSVVPEKPVLIFLYNYFKKKGRSGGTFVDIGGFIGLHSFIAKISNAMTRVYIFEADKYKCQILKKNIIDNNFNNVHLENKFITGSSSIRNPKDFTSYTNNNVSINDFILKKNISYIDILKMDIEGFEYYALKNVKFKKIKILLLEFHNTIIKNELKKNPNEIIKILEKNYNLFYLNHNEQSSPRIIKFQKKFLKNKSHVMLVCTNLNIATIRKYIDTNVSIEKII
jgi:FkbM family methyltransferase